MASAGMLAAGVRVRVFAGCTGQPLHPVRRRLIAGDGLMSGGALRALAQRQDHADQHQQHGNADD